MFGWCNRFPVLDFLPVLCFAVTAEAFSFRVFEKTVDQEYVYGGGLLKFPHFLSSTDCWFRVLTKDASLGYATMFDFDLLVFV